VRPGRSEDLPGVLDLWRADVRSGRRDCIPGEGQLRRVLADFDWEARARIVESPAGALDAAVLVLDRATHSGTVATVDASAVDDRPDLVRDLTRWGLGLSKAAGAVAAQVWLARGKGEGLDRLGLENVRPWWRMDRSLASEPDAPSPVDGYVLSDAELVPAGTWSRVHNLSFADHWRFSARTETELMTGRKPDLSLMAMARDGSAAALTVCQVETYMADLRPQPVGVISSVGTVPDHRRRGLATWLVAESLVRLRLAGARHASLYVDGLNPFRAFDAYSKLGFDLAFETEVWEATFR
jgi:ribosomal protein S18 acetylase RimI-like enzyme